MTTKITNFISRSSKAEWKALEEDGIDTKGLYVKPLRYDKPNGRPLSFLLKFEPGAKYPYHNHPAGEEIMVLEGSCTIEGETLVNGDYLYTPPNFKHAVRSEKGCLLFLMVPEEVEILGE